MQIECYNRNWNLSFCTKHCKFWNECRAYYCKSNNLCFDVDLENEIAEIKRNIEKMKCGSED